ncbi:MAG: 2-hydroxychromene-2-carboxylate isomerase [Burkholderiales bacterium]
MAASIDFYFDFSSPYGYFASTKIESLAAKHGRTVNWRPVLLGIIFKTTGGAPMPTLPLKGDYASKDFPRSARFLGVPYRTPGVFPIGTMSAVRAFYWLQGKDPAKAVAFAKALYKAYFVDDVNISDAAGLARVAQSLGLNADEMSAGINDAAVKEKVKAEVDVALARGVCGSPFIIVDGEPFWGADRLDQVEKWLATGGF